MDILHYCASNAHVWYNNTFKKGAEQEKDGRGDRARKNQHDISDAEEGKGTKRKVCIYRNVREIG